MNEAYLLEGEFLTNINHDLRLIQRKNGLAFGTDAYLLSAFVREHTSGVGADLGSGSGVIAMLLAKRHPNVVIHAIELQTCYAEKNGVIARNAKLNGLEERVFPVSMDIRNMTPRIFGRELDFVVSNPPYMRADAGRCNHFVEKQQARHAQNGEIEDFCQSASRVLKHGGLFYVVYRPDRLVDLICALREYHLEPKRMRFVSEQVGMPPSIVLVEAKKGAKPSVSLPEVFYLRQDGEMHPKLQAIYDGGYLL